MAEATTEFSATARWIRVSPQKARLVLDLIKGQRVEDALNTLMFTNKRVATQVYKLVRSALDNVNYLSSEKGIDVDIDNLYVRRAIANDGPRMKRIRPAPQGRAYRYQRRMSHIEVALAEKARPEGATVAPRPKRSASAKAVPKPAAQPAGIKKSGAKRFGLNRPWPGGKK
jgi:large subunit ribosomal protein L22